MKTSLLALTTAAAWFLSALSPAQAQFACASGFEHSTGTYGQATSTEITTLYVIPEYTYRDWTARLYVPRLRVSGTAGAIVVNGRPRLQRYLNARAQEQDRTASGLGDVEASATYRVRRVESAGWELAFTGSVKLPTADEADGLGTGAVDYDFSVDLSRALGRVVPFAALGYCFVGKTDDYDLRDYAYARVGVAVWVADAVNVALHFQTAQRSSDSMGSDSGVALGVSYQFAEAWNIELHGLAGVSEAAPDRSLGASLRLQF